MNEDGDTPMGEFKGGTANFQYNRDLTGFVAISNALGSEIEIDMEDLVNFVAEVYVRPRLIKCINATPPRDLLLNQLNPLGD